MDENHICDFYKPSACKNAKVLSLFWVLFVVFVLSSCFNNNKQQGLYPVFDVNKNYPEKEFVMDDADWEYIPLETTPEVLADRDFMLQYVSDSLLVGTNRSRGDVFVFDRNGKVISFFNHLGNGGIDYQSIRAFAYDEVNKEIFIADVLSKKRCVVYSEDGKFLRQFNFPDGSWIGAIYNFNDTTLFAYNELRPAIGESDSEEFQFNQQLPYVFLSKKDGSFISRLDLSFSERLSDRHITYTSNDVMRAIGIGYNTKKVKYGEEFIISDRSSDTVFLLTQDKNLKPLFVRTPSVFAKSQYHTVMSVHFKTEKYLFFVTITYDLPRVIELQDKGQNTQEAIQMKHFALDLHTGDFFMPVGEYPIGEDIDAPAYTVVSWRTSDFLIERLEAGRLDGKWKQIAQTIKEEDNPVVEIYKVKID